MKSMIHGEIWPTQLAVEINEDQANLAGVTNAAVAQTLNAFFSGHYLTTYREGDHKVPIYLRLPTEQQGNLRLLDQIYVEGSNGKVPLDELATIQPRWQPGKIVRRDQTRCIEVRCRVARGKLANTVVREIKPYLRKWQKKFPDGYRVEIGGEFEESVESQGYMARSFAISLILIIMCLIVQYNSFAKTIIVMLTIPLATTGSLLGLFLTGQPLGFMPMLGLLSLAGVVINVSIVLLEFIEHEIKLKLKNRKQEISQKERTYGGLSLEEFRECIVAGTKMRILPIALTTLTTVGGLLPLAAGGDPLFAPMAITIMSGLIFSTLLALFVTPAIYAFFVEVLRMDPL